MAIIEDQRPLELTTGEEAAPANPLGVFARPKSTTGWRSWVSTVDHKKIGIMYGVASFFFLLVGGAEALLIRLQLAVPGNRLLSADLYNQVFTMHGVTMVFLVIMPLAAAFANYLLPLQIGARDVSFPRMNALSLWIWLFGAVFFNTSWLLGGGADGGWFNYAPNSGVVFSPGHGIDFYAVGLLIMGIGSTVSAINLTVTVLNMRAPGMTLMKMPVFTWMTFVDPGPAGLRPAGHHRGAAAPDLRPHVRRQLLQRTDGWRSVPVAAPLLDLRSPRGVHHDPAGVRHRERGHPGLLPQADLRLPVHGRLRHRHRLHGLRRVGAPHVRLGHGSDVDPGLLAGDDVHRRAHRCEDPQLAGHDVRRSAAVHHRHAVLGRPGRHVHHRWTVGREPRVRPGGHPADRHLLHRRPLPLRALRWGVARTVQRDVLLVAEDVRALPGREARQVALLADPDRLQPHLRSPCTSWGCRA